MKPVIFVFSLAYQPYLGGAELALQEIIERLPDYRFRVYTAYALKHFSTPHSLPREEGSERVRIIRVGPRGRLVCQYGFPFFALLRALRDARSVTPSLLWGMLESYGGITALLFQRFFRAPVPYLLTMQSGDSEMFWRLRTWFWRPIYRLVYTRANAIQAISSFLARRAEAMGAASRVITVIPNGVQVDRFSKHISPDERSAIRHSWGLTDAQDFSIITSSRLVHKNGIDTLIKGYAQWRTAQPSLRARLIIAGKGPQESWLRALARSLPIASEILFLGEIPYAQLPRYLQSADIFARVSRSEGLGIAFLDAMAAGIPVIAPLIGGIPDFLRHNETGLAVRVDDPHDVARALARLAEDPALRTRLATTASALVQSYFSWDAVTRRMRDLFEGARVPMRKPQPI